MMNERRINELIAKETIISKEIELVIRDREIVKAFRKAYRKAHKETYKDSKVYVHSTSIMKELKERFIYLVSISENERNLEYIRISDMTAKDYIQYVNNAHKETFVGIDRNNDVIVSASPIETLIGKLILKQVNKAYERFFWLEKYRYGTNDFYACRNYVMTELYIIATEVSGNTPFYELIVKEYVNNKGEQRHKSIVRSLMHQHYLETYPRHRLQDANGKLIDTYNCEATEELDYIASSHYADPENTTIAKIMRESIQFYDDRLNRIYAKANNKVVSYMLDYMDGKTMDDIAKAYNVKKSAINMALKRSAKLA